MTYIDLYCGCLPRLWVTLLTVTLCVGGWGEMDPEPQLVDGDGEGGGG